MRADQVAEVHERLVEFVAEVFSSLPRSDQRAKGSLYLQGLMLDGRRTSMHPVVARARTLMPPVTVTVDLTCAEHVEAGAVDLLRWALEHDRSTIGAGAVEVVAPDQLPAHRPVPAGPSPGAPHGWRADRYEEVSGYSRVGR